MPFKQTCICLTRSVCTKCGSHCVFAKTKPQFNYHHGSALKFRNTCRRNLTQRFFSWSSPVVPKVWVETQTKVEKGQKMGGAKARNWSCVFSTLCLLFSVRLWHRHMRKRWLTWKMILATCYQKSPMKSFFWGLGRGLQTQIMGGTQKSLRSTELVMLS